MERYSLYLNKFGSIMPMPFFLCIISYIYITYLTAYLLPKLKEKDVGSVDNEKNLEFIINSQDGALYWALILHFFITLFLISYFGTFKTDPGKVPAYWHSMVLEELNHFDEKIRAAFEQRNLLSKSAEIKNSNINKETPENLDRNSLSDQGLPWKYDDSTNLDGKLDDVKLSEMEDEFLRKKGFERFCCHCQSFKPPRTHHCRECGRCVLKMDHHCPWVLNCIGFYNYKLFFNMLIHGDIVILMMATTFIPFAYEKIYIENEEYPRLFLYSTVLGLMIMIASLLTAFLFFHLTLVLAGKSTVENCGRNKMKKFDYSLGCARNFLAVFGKNPLLWFLPVIVNAHEDGVTFTQNFKH